MSKAVQALVAIQARIRAPKDQKNAFAGFNYRNAEGILEAVKPLLNGLALVISDEPVMVGDRVYIKATVTLTDGSESVSAVAYAREDESKKGMDGCQLTGACSSYARKYALNALLMIDDSKDSDDDSLSPKNPANEPKEPPKPATVEKVSKLPADVTMQAQAVQLQAIPPKKPESTPVQLYLVKAMKELREAREISVKENNKLFKEQKAVLVAKGLVPDKKSEEYTMEEAQTMINLMYTRFAPTGTELKAE